MFGDTYDGNGNPVSVLDITNQIEYTYVYENGRLLCEMQSEGAYIDDSGFKHPGTLQCKTVYRYNSKGNVAEKTFYDADGSIAEKFVYTDDGNSTVILPTGAKARSRSDKLGRLEFDEVQTGSGAISRKLDYVEGSVPEEYKNEGKVLSAPTTNLVERISYSDGDKLEYTYDAEERITSVTGKYTSAYEYDCHGQLTKETYTSSDGIDIVEVEYDAVGNITEKDGKRYDYENDTWRDLLTAYNGKAIDYDELGNPTNYLGNALTWTVGRKLQSFSSDDLDISYKYNSLGQRIRKTVGSTKHEYFYGGTRLEKEVRTELDGTIHTLVFLYDASDSPIGMQYDGTAYYYKKNLQGDVIALLDATCNTVAEYIYDAWGALRIIKASTANTTIAEANPIRYRGYYYDNETGFYFLQSRYYDPVIGRFINADDAVFLNKSNVVSSCNLFSYCNNNPMRYIDPFGFWSESWGIFDEQQANDFALYLDDLRRDNDAEYYDPIAELSFGSFIEFCANKIAEKLAVESSTLAFLPGAVSIAIATLTITTTLKSVIELKALDEYDLVANAVRKAIKQSKSKKLILFFLNGYKTVEIKIADNANGYVYSIIMLTATNLGPYIEFAEKVNVTLYEREVGNDYSYPEM